MNVREWRTDLPDVVWRGLGRLRVAAGLGVAAAGAATGLGRRVPPATAALLVLFAAGFAVVSVLGLRCRARRFEVLSMAWALAMNTTLALASGGPDSPLLFVFLVPVFTHGFRWGPTGAYVSAAANTAALLGLAGYGLAAGEPPGALVPAGLVCCVMWVGARTVSLVVSALGAQREELRVVSQVDPLTGVLNRRSLFDAAAVLAQRGRPFAVVLVDLDGFKAVNDTRGHLFGDEVLRHAARAMREAVRREDLVARYGGDEFAVLVPGGRAEGEFVLGRLKEAVLRAARELGADTSLSGGVAVWPDDGAGVEDVLRAADRRLYLAKDEQGPRG